MNIVVLDSTRSLEEYNVGMKNTEGGLCMNEEIILGMARPYVKDSAITYDDFGNIYKMLSIKEQYEVTNILFRNGINLVDEDEKVDEESFVLASEADDNDFEILYDESIFKDGGTLSKDDEILTINYDIKQSNNILCHLIQKGNRQAGQDLCVKNKRLVDKYVMLYQKRFGNRLDFEDLEQVGFLGLIKAAQKFDFQQGAAFSTYAVFWIKQAISREIIDNGYVIRIPVHMMERVEKVIRLDNILVGKGIKLFQRIKDIAAELGITEETVRECLVLKNNYLLYASLNMPIGAEEETELGELIPDEDILSVEDEVFATLLHEQLEEVLETLTEREERILRLRYGLDDGCKRTLEEIGQEFNVTRERVRQIEAKALKKLRHPSKSQKIKDYLE